MPDGLYETDFHAWALAQAAALRAAGVQDLNADIDWVNVAEEIESLGSEQAYALESAFTRAIEHILKLEYSPAVKPRRGWRLTVAHQRVEIERRLRRNPSLESRLGEFFTDAWRGARTLATLALKLYDDLDPATLPLECPYSIDQVRSPDWWPINRHGLK